MADLRTNQQLSSVKQVNQPYIGMKLGTHPSSLKEGEYSVLLNGILQAADGKYLKIINEQSNILCTQFREGLQVINATFIPSLNLTFFFLVNPNSGESEIGTIKSSHSEDTNDRTTECKDCNHPTVEDTPLEQTTQIAKCTYNTFVNADCLNFSIDHPIRIWVKVDDCNVRIYFTDYRNPLRYIDYEDYQKEEIDTCPPTFTTELDCNKIKIFPDSCYPKIEYTDIYSGGLNTAGTLQFAVAYSDANSNALSSYITVSNPIPIADKEILLDDRLDYTVAKSVKLQITDISQDFKYLNLVVLKTINNTTTPYLVNTFNITDTTFNYTYTGLGEKMNLSLEELFKKKPVYTKARNVTESNGYLLFQDLVEDRQLNLQPVFNDLPVFWQTVELDEGAYKNPIVAADYRGYLGDEIYALAIEFIRNNTNKTARFHIPGRQSIPSDLLEECASDNKDVFDTSLCTTDTDCLPYWKVYNTASVTGDACNYDPISQTSTNTITDSCTSDTFYQDPTTGLYYGSYDYSTYTYSDLFGAVPPTSYSDCGDCADQMEIAHPDCTPLGSTSALDIVVPTSNVQVPVYDSSPTIPAFVVPTTLPTVDEAANISIDTAAPLNNFATPCSSPLYSVLEDGSGSSLTTWYQLQPYAATFGITFNAPVGNTYDINIYTSSNNLPTGTLTLLDSAVGVTQEYFLFENYTTGYTLFIEVTNCAAGATNVFSVCTDIPEAVSETTVTLPNVVQYTCFFEFDCQVSLNSSACTPPNYKYGGMAYWESTERYPCNTEVWGNLADTPIRHHKFPDHAISPIFENKNSTSTDGAQEYKGRTKIYPKGIRIDVADIKRLLNQAVEDGLITREEKESICGYRILRSNRIGNQSVIGKGLLYDVWTYRDNVYSTGQSILYPNYPYNDLNPDIFHSVVQINNLFQANNVLYPQHPYQGVRNNTYTFHSPETSYNNPTLGAELKLETEFNGYMEGRYAKVKNHSEYQYMGAAAILSAYYLAVMEASYEGVVATCNVDTSIMSAENIAFKYIVGNMAVLSGTFKHYYEWLDLIEKFAPFRNFAWYHSSVGNYNRYLPVFKKQMRRQIVDAQYLRPGVQGVQQDNVNIKFNNLDRESGVYINIKDYFRSPSQVDTSRWFPGDGTASCLNIGYQYRPISSYYASLKNNLPNQYGTIDQIEYIDTGYNGTIDWDNPNQTSACDTIFGGDTFIGRHALKRKHPFFIEDRVTTQGSSYADNADVLYNELGNIHYPRFFFNYPASSNLSDTEGGELYSIFGNVALLTPGQADYNFSCIQTDGHGWMIGGASVMSMAATFASSIGVIQGSIMGTVGLSAFPPLLGVNLLDQDTFNVYPKGRIFLYNYGVPYFICESSINLDLRHGTNYKEKDFYPNVGDVLTWTQQTNVPIQEDNFYQYNLTYSKQNTENSGYTLAPDFNQEKEDCKAIHENRVIYSLQDIDSNDKFDGNLVFLANNYFDFSKNGGKVKIIKGSSNNSVLVIQEDQASLFNSFVTLQTSIGATAVGSNTLFSQQPAQYIKTDLGYGGSQTSAIITTEFGHFWVDNKRGNILNLQSQLNSIINPDEEWWFKENLPFKILNHFPEVDIDNPFKAFGVLLAYDQRYKRLIITKKDSVPIIDGITFSDNNFYYNGNIISPFDTKYFCNKSYTISYDLINKVFSSFHSYLPNYYVPNNTYFSSGLNSVNSTFWNHNLTNKSYQVFYGTLYPFLLEYSTKQTIPNTILNSISYLAEFNRYSSHLDYYLNPNITYNKALVYNQNQSTGNLSLIPKRKNDMSQLFTNGKIVSSQTQVLVENIENYWNFNYLFDVSRNNRQPLLHYECSPTIKEVNPSSIDLFIKGMKNQLRGDYFQIRLINDIYSNYQITHRLSIQDQTPT